MSEPLERAQELFAAFEAELRAELPAGADIFDAHTHLGDDIDGMAGRYDELEAIMDQLRHLARATSSASTSPTVIRGSARETTARSSPPPARTAG